MIHFSGSFGGSPAGGLLCTQDLAEAGSQLPKRTCSLLRMALWTERLHLVLCLGKLSTVYSIYGVLQSNTKDRIGVKTLFP